MNDCGCRECSFCIGFDDGYMAGRDQPAGDVPLLVRSLQARIKKLENENKEMARRKEIQLKNIEQAIRNVLGLKPKIVNWRPGDGGS